VNVDSHRLAILTGKEIDALYGVRQRFLHFSAISYSGMVGKLRRVRV